MGKILVIAEKPSVAQDYAKVLGAKTKGNGCISGNGYIVSWAVGHLVELSPPEAYDERLKRWTLQDLPIMPEVIKHRVVESSKKQFYILKELMNSPEVDSIVCGTDSGREGELIFRYIYYAAGCKKPFSRLWVSSMTEEAITEGFRNLKDGSEYDSLYSSAKCRSEADWLVGINGTRAYTKSSGVLYSVGRVQTPTLSIIVKRQAEIDNFVPKDYYEIELKHDGFTSTWFEIEADGKTKNTRIDEENKAGELLAAALKCGKGTVLDVTKTKKKQLPPQLYDLTELQRDGNKKYGYTAERVLNLAQALYEKHKILTYPRTDSRYISDDMKATIPNVLKAISIPELEKAIENMPKPVFTRRICDNTKITDHHAIIPTNKRPNLANLNQDERNIYMLVATRLIEVFYPPYEYESTEVIIGVENEKYLARGKHVIDPGYTVLADKSRKSDDDDTELPPLKKKDEVPILGGEVKKKQTTPPSPYTEATLLTAMEYAGKYVEDEALRETMTKLSLGTPATRASIIERLINVQYIERKGKSLVPTAKGKELIKIVPVELKSPEMTGKWEKALDKIYAKEMDSQRFMDSIRRYVIFIVNSAISRPAAAIEPEISVKPKSRGKSQSAPKNTESKPKAPVKGSLGKCPMCGEGSVIKNSKAYYCSRWREKCKFTIWFDALDMYDAKLDDEMMKSILAGKGVQIKMHLPQTHESGTGELVLDAKHHLDIKNFKPEKN